MATKIFINYRRGDVRSDAARIRDRLAAVFGARNVFMDVENLVAGQRFDMALHKELAQCDVLLAMIGPRWLDLLKERQGSGEGDLVREEITTALKRAIPIIPVLIDRTPLPRPDELPEELRNLVMYHKHDITHEHFGREVEELIAAIKANSPAGAEDQNSGGARKWGLMAAGAAAAIAIAVFSAQYAGVPLPWLKSGGAGASSGDRASVSVDESRQKGSASGSQKTTALDPAVEARKREEAAMVRPGRVFRDCQDLCPEMVVIGAGEFSMGSANGEEDEKPVHKVTISKPFAVGTHEVTFAEWDACVTDGGCQNKPDADWGRDKPAGHARFMGRGDEGIPAVAVAQGGCALQAAQRVGMGVCGTAGYRLEIFDGRADYAGASAILVTGERPRSDPFRKAPGASATFTATSGNGFRTATTTATAASRRTDGRHPRWGAACASCAEARGATAPMQCGRPIASGTAPTAAAMSWASASRARCEAVSPARVDTAASPP